tara:strand:+ start:2302 stop:2874 length:573 start_codon:yes stop_codon:yes gene_type:complete
MDDFENLKQLWNSKNTLDIPNLKQIQTVIKKYQRKKKRNIYLLIALLILCCIVLILVFTFHKPLLWTTTFGEILISIGFILGMILKLSTLKSITKNELKSNKAFLEDLIKVSIKKKPKANWLQIISALLIAIGYGFFIYEEIKENQTELILSYFGITLFSLGMYFIFRPFIKRNSKKKIKKMLEGIENLN